MDIIYFRFMIKAIILCLVMQIALSKFYLYSLNANYEISTEIKSDELAHGYYFSEQKETGWNRFYLYANKQQPLLEQHRAAGYIEGYATYIQIYAAYNNYLKSTLNNTHLSQQIQSFIDEQLEFIDYSCEINKGVLFWDYVKAYLEQVRYMHVGYLERVLREDRLEMKLEFKEFYYLAMVGDLQDLIPAYQNGYLQGQKLGNCNGFIKYINQQFYVGHSTHNIYPLMLRIFKTFNFPTSNSEVGSQTITFSSRPGDMISKDDFYVLSNGMKIFQTSLQNFNKENYKELSSRTLPSWIRSSVAMNLAKNGRQWIDYFNINRSGTHNNHWVILDEKQLKNNKDVILFLEEGFSQFKIVDATERLMNQGYIASYNQASDPYIYAKLGHPTTSNPYNYENDPRALIYAKYDKEIQTVDDMKKWLITNEEEDARVGIAPRYDVKESSNHKAFGLTDCKIVTPESEEENYIWAINGPSTSNGRFQPFSWSNWENEAHQGMPTVFDFKWEKIIIDVEREESKNKILKEE